MTTLTHKITALLYREKSNLKNLVALENADDVAKDVQALLNRYYLTLRNHLRNTAPRMPGSDTEQHAYPDRESVKPDYVEVPDPSETETSIPSKTSTPQYVDFQEALERLQTNGETVFAEETSEDKVESMREAIAALDDLSSMLKKM